MPIRDILLTAVVFGSLPFCLVRPYIGVLVWSWLAFMSPHRLSWGFAADVEFSKVVAIATVVGVFFSTDRRPIPPVRESVLVAGFWGLTILTSLFALYPELAWKDLTQFSKILLMNVVAVMLFQDRRKLRYLLLVTALSIGFFGLRGGIWGLRTGGAHGWVLGPEGSFIGDNNGLALGLNMVLPFLWFLAREETRGWLRMVLYAMFVFSILAVILTYSRSGFLGLVVVLFVLMAGMKRKVFLIACAIAGMAAAAAFLPERWFDRIQTIGVYGEDASAMSRLHAWKIGWQLAVDSPFLGGGFRAFQPEVWARYLPEYSGWHNAHSIYFHVLGEHGFPGLFLLTGLIVSTLLSLREIRRDAKKIPNGSWLVNYSYMIRASLLGYVVTGAFQNLTYFDLFWLLIGITIVLKRLAKDLGSSSARGDTKPSIARTGVPSGRDLLNSPTPPQ